MCIRYNHSQTEKLRARKSERFRVYKVYRTYDPNSGSILGDDPCLFSPYNSDKKSGIIKNAGTHSATNVYAKEKGVGRTISNRRINKKNIATADGYALNAWGFHCFLSKKSAMNFNYHATYTDGVVVSLMVNRKDLIVAGTENGDRSATFSHITISESSFQRALKGKR